jgi:hypothetical protein
MPAANPPVQATAIDRHLKGKGLYFDLAVLLPPRQRTFFQDKHY